MIDGTIIILEFSQHLIVFVSFRGISLGMLGIVSFIHLFLDAHCYQRAQLVSIQVDRIVWLHAHMLSPTMDVYKQQHDWQQQEQQQQQPQQDD